MKLTCLWCLFAPPALSTAPAESGPVPDQEAHAIRSDSSDEGATPRTLRPGDLNALKWRSIGPANMSGRLAAIALAPGNAKTYFIGYGTGGLWKTTNTAQLADLTRTGEVLVSATGVPGVIRTPMVKPGAVVIDVGMAPITDPRTGRDRLVGDVAFDEVSEVAAFVSPVPGGVGAMTVAMLLRNTADSASRE